MTRFATSADIQNIKSLWLEAFGDSLHYIDSFISNIGNPSRCLIIEEDNSILSMTYLLPCQLTTRHGLRNAFYIYAMCSSKKHQGKGHATILLNAAYEYAKEKNALAIVLVPASDTLAEFYSFRGYKWFYAKPSFNDLQMKNSIQKLDKNHYQLIKEAQLSLFDHELSVIWPFEHLKFALNEKQSDGVHILVEEDGYKLIESDNQSIIEAMPLPQNWNSNTPKAMIRFCEPYQYNSDSSPYFNWGLE